MNRKLLRQAGFSVLLASLSLATQAQTNLNLGNVFNSANMQNTPGLRNVLLGLDAGNALTAGGNYNMLSGSYAGFKITSGDFNVGVGYASLYDVVSTSRNTALGAYSGYNVTSDENAFVGYQALSLIHI